MKLLGQLFVLGSLDYYLERISIKLADLFGTFSTAIILIGLLMVFCSFLLWLVIPFIEIRKQNILQKICHRLEESEKILISINKHLGEAEKKPEKHFLNGD